MKKRIFMDYASITPIDPRVSISMKKIEKDFFANPSSLYSEGIESKTIIKESKSKIADILHCQKDEIFFTSGGTESNNIAILGIFEKLKNNFKPHFITLNTEHPSVLEVFREIENRGGEVTYLTVDEDGLISLKDLRQSLKKNTVLVSISYANNEIGVVQPIKEISKIIKDWKEKNKNNFPYFHTDACQASLYLSLDVLKLGVDLLTLDGIKMYGPRGTGVLFVKSSVDIKSVIFGGGQQKGLRSGTENIPAIYGIALAMTISEKLKEKENLRLIKLRDFMIDLVLKEFPRASLNGSKEFRLPNNVNVCFRGLDAEYAVIQLDVLGIACSYSSSCRTLKENSSSYVISSLKKEDCASSSLRFTFGRETTKEDIKKLISALKKIVVK